VWASFWAPAWVPLLPQGGAVAEVVQRPLPLPLPVQRPQVLRLVPLPQVLPQQQAAVVPRGQQAHRHRHRRPR